MKIAKKIVALGMIAFWALMSNHCALEMVPGLSFLACSPQTEAARHLPDDCGDEGDACATVESGNYRSEESLVSAGKAPMANAFVLALLSDLPDLESLASRPSLEIVPPELARVWQFSFRTALPPRAPSRLS